jgi:hypothetical protein
MRRTLYGPVGKTPLHVAAKMVCPDMVAVLLDHHAIPNLHMLTAAVMVVLCSPPPSAHQLFKRQWQQGRERAGNATISRYKSGYILPYISTNTVSTELGPFGTY